jgi:hypothetical protein
MAVLNATAVFQGRGLIVGPWPPAPILADVGVPGVPGNPQPLRPYGGLGGCSCDPAFASPGPPGDPVVLARAAAWWKSQTGPITF